MKQRMLASRRLWGPRLRLNFSRPWEIRDDGTWFALQEQQAYISYKIFFLSLILWLPESEEDKEFSLYRTREEEALIISGNNLEESRRLLELDRLRAYLPWGFKT